MAKYIDRTGQRFNRLTVVSRSSNIHNKVVWQCVCDCGKEVRVVAGALVTGNTGSCGCYLRDKVTKHGGWKKSSYNTWRAMLRRCYNTLDKDYKNYGAVGIIVCKEWHSYTAFESAMGEPVGEETLDRIDPYGNYTPENCRWANITVQNRNTRPQKRSRSGAVGVIPANKKWIAQITKNGRKYYSMVCDTIELAVAERKKLELTHWSDV